jgi:hypothetical protein
LEEHAGANCSAEGAVSSAWAAGEKVICMKNTHSEMTSNRGSGVATASRTANPKRVAAGRRNRLMRRGLTPEGRERLRQTAFKHQPWRFATGPRSVEGKARSAANGKKRQKGAKSVREIRAELADIGDLVRQLRELRRTVGVVAVP